MKNLSSPDHRCSTSSGARRVRSGNSDAESGHWGASALSRFWMPRAERETGGPVARKTSQRPSAWCLCVLFLACSPSQSAPPHKADPAPSSPVVPPRSTVVPTNRGAPNTRRQEAKPTLPSALATEIAHEIEHVTIEAATSLGPDPCGAMWWVVDVRSPPNDGFPERVHAVSIDNETWQISRFGIRDPLDA